jgi:FKBP-type peptidyl-prolyl cis-trans isomerase
LAYEDGGAGGGVQESAVGKEAAAAQGRDENLPPQVNTEVQVLQQGVTKQIMKEGHGDAPPPRHSTCFVHYRAWTESTMHKFEDTWLEQQPMELHLGHGEL